MLRKVILLIEKWKKGDLEARNQVFELVYLGIISSNFAYLFREETIFVNEDLTLLTASSLSKINDRYCVEKEIGRGGIGIIFKAKDTKTNEYVVIKVLHDFLANDYWIVEKFTKEAKTIVDKLKDVEGVVKGIEEGVLPNGSAYLVMEYIEGKELKELVKRDSIGMDLERSANIIKQLGETLTKIHKHGVYHRDLKPANIMLTMKNGEEQVKVIDFGIATVKESPDEKTKSTAIAGTPAYMAPEQILGKPTDKSDIYAMGVIAYEMITGRIPFNVRGFPSVLAPIKLHEMQEAGIIVKPKQLRPELSDETDALILKALAFNPQERFATAQEFGLLLSQSLVNEAPPTMIKKIPTPVIPTNSDKFAETLIPNNSKETVVQESVKTNKTNKPQTINLMVIALVVIAFLGITGGIYKAITNSTPNSKPSVAASTPITTTPTVANKLSFMLELQEFRDGKYQPPIEILGEKLIFHNKDQIRFSILAKESGYLYLLNQSPKPLADDIPNYFLLFPTNKENNYFEANQEVTIPKKSDEGLEFSGSTGTEQIWIVWSKKQIPELDAVKPEANKEVVEAIKNAEQAKAIKQLLSKYHIDKLEQNKAAKKMEAITSENSMTVVFELEHR
jgi:serine/threonine protein kinase